ncbi:unnamed protein product, partial [Closterium sp. NIES-54]
PVARPVPSPSLGPYLASRPAPYLPSARPCTCPAPGPVPVWPLGPPRPLSPPLGPWAPCLAPRPLGPSAPPQRLAPGSPRPLVWPLGPPIRPPPGPLFGPAATRPLGPTTETDGRPRTCPVPGPVPSQRPAPYLPSTRPCTCPTPGPVPALTPRPPRPLVWPRGP